MKKMTKIVKKEQILGGKPVIEGTRISVELIMNYISNDLDIENIKQAYPFLTNEQIIAAIDHVDTNIHRQKAKLEPTPT